MNKPTNVEVVDALMGMAIQYLEGSDNKVHCDYVSASEHCIDVLERLQILKDGQLDYSLMNESALESHMSSL